jgi:dephospho-CoA kinase
MPIVIAFAGKIGSGKTSVTNALAESLGCPRACFGDYVREVVRERGLPLTRANLQFVGTELLENDMHGFCRAVILSCGWNPGESLVIDGLRHEETIKLIEQLVSPTKLKIVFLQVDEDTRIRRLTMRGDGDSAALTQAAAHSSENQVNSTLIEKAHLVLQASEPIPTIVRQVQEWIRQQ